MKINFRNKILAAFTVVFFAVIFCFFYGAPAGEEFNFKEIKTRMPVAKVEKTDPGKDAVKTENSEIAAVETDNNIGDVGLKKEELFLLDIPFTPQAPFGEWSDPRQQDACEEASALMAVRWARGQELEREEAKKEILAISKYQSENFGEFRDTSAEDTLKRIIIGYFKYDKAEVKKITAADDIIKEIEAGHAVIVPANGRKLGNPYFTPPGPERHMVVIKGYDEQKREFITNDTGTKRGEGYRYKKDIFFSAIRDYSTGYHEPIIKEEKAMIIIKK